MYHWSGHCYELDVVVSSIPEGDSCRNHVYSDQGVGMHQHGAADTVAGHLSRLHIAVVATFWSENTCHHCKCHSIPQSK